MHGALAVITKPFCNQRTVNVQLNALADSADLNLPACWARERDNAFKQEFAMRRRSRWVDHRKRPTRLGRSGIAGADL